jgi:methyl-accepting chemotaxis protein
MIKLWNGFWIGLRIQSKLSWLVGLFLASFLVFGVVAYQTLSELRVNGELDQRIALRDELLAETSPPRISLLDAYMKVHILEDEENPARAARLITELQQREADFESQFEVWRGKLEDGPLKAALTRTVPPARAFYRSMNQEFIPAVKRSDMAELTRVARALQTSFDANQTALEEVVRIAQQEDHTQRQEADQILKNRTSLLLGIGVLMLVLTLIVGVAIARSIALPLGAVVERAQSISAGDLRQPALVVPSRDETGRLAAVFNEMVERLSAMARQTRDITRSLNASAAQILAATQQQAASTAEQSAAIHETTATMEEISHSGAQISEKARQVAAAGEAASVASNSGLEAVRGVRASMQSIHEQAGAVAENIVDLSARTQAVGEIIASVNEIAEQSNLLALNAAIEAAAAGEHGRSFSVVAAEMKNLAEQSKQATRQVRNILGEIQKGINTSVMLTEEAVKRVETGGQQVSVAEQTIQEMAQNIVQSIQAFQQIVAATNQQQIGFDQVTRAIQNIRDASEQSAAGTGQLEHAASNLGELGLRLQAAVEAYKV